MWMPSLIALVCLTNSSVNVKHQLKKATIEPSLQYYQVWMHPKRMWARQSKAYLNNFGLLQIKQAHFFWKHWGIICIFYCFLLFYWAPLDYNCGQSESAMVIFSCHHSPILNRHKWTEDESDELRAAVINISCDSSSPVFTVTLFILPLLCIDLLCFDTMSAGYINLSPWWFDDILSGVLHSEGPRTSFPSFPEAKQNKLVEPKDV